MKSEDTQETDGVKMRLREKYAGITYPKVLDNALARWVWRRFFCPKGWHLWDECFTRHNFLFCDACEIDLTIRPDIPWTYNQKDTRGE